MQNDIKRPQGSRSTKLTQNHANWTDNSPKMSSNEGMNTSIIRR
ncbi:hypothetical protein LINPERHAP1_LOCUS30448, partial [Linum perenne]